MTSLAARPSAPPPSAGALNRLRAQQVDTLFKNVTPGVLGAGIANCGLELILLHFGAIDPTSGVVWFAFMAFCVATHLLLLRFYRTNAPDENLWCPWAFAFTSVALLEGAGWGWASVFLNASHRVDLQLLIVCVSLVIATGAVPAFGSYFPAFAAFFLPACLPYAVASLFAVDPVLHATAYLMPVYAVAIFILGIQTTQNFKELVQLRIRTAELAEDLRAQKDLAEQANLSKSNFLAAASHDLRQPVHAIGLFVGALRAVALPRQALRLVQQIDASVAALDSLFGALLDISRLDAGVVEVRKQAFSIGPLIERICRDYDDEARAKGLAITRCASSARVQTDPILVERILRNLVSNAVRYTREGGVVVGCRRAGLSVRAEVWDTGVGIPKAYQQRVFEEYFQLENPERDRAKGLGLGLAIIRRLANLLQCELSLRSEPGKGSCFRLTLALADDRDAAGEAAKEIEATERGRGLLVVIDDEAAIREAMATLLQGWGYAVISAGSGDEMLDKLASHPACPDLIISDYRLRGEETGVQAIARLQSEYNEAIPGLLVTGDTAKDRLTEAQASGLVLLHKPVPNGKLRAAIVHLMAASREGG